MLTDINSEDRPVQEACANHLRDKLGWESVYAWNEETLGPDGTLGRADTRGVVYTRDLWAAIERLNPELPPAAEYDEVRVPYARQAGPSAAGPGIRTRGAYRSASGGRPAFSRARRMCSSIFGSRSPRTFCADS